MYEITTTFFLPPSCCCYICWVFSLRLFVVFTNSNQCNLPKSYNSGQRVCSHSPYCIVDISVICSAIQKQTFIFLTEPMPAICQAMANVTENHGDEKHFLVQHIPKHFRLKSTPSCASILKELLISLKSPLLCKPMLFLYSMNRPYSPLKSNNQTKLA